MARPKTISGAPTACDRMVAAFWELLEEKPFERITVRELAARAGVNKNSFYYHFDALRDVAQRAIDELIVEEIPRAVVESTRPTVEDLLHRILGIDIEHRLARVKLLLGDHGAALAPLVESRAVATWLRVLNLDAARIEEEDLLFIRFCVGGILSVMRAISIDGLRARLNRPEGFAGLQASLSALNAIAQKYANAA